MIWCKGNNVYICIKCKRYDPKATKLKYVKTSDNIQGCKFYKDKVKCG